MPTTTRSATRQPKLEQVKGTETEAKPPNQNRKRKVLSGETTPVKRSRTAASESSALKADSAPGKQRDGEGDEVITINRAPVLELWAAVVAQFLHPSLSWDTCLSIGGAISTITAISKGRSIGTIATPEAGEAEKRKRKREARAEKGVIDEIEVMGFRLGIKDGQAMVGEKPRKGNEVALRSKYGNEAFEKTKNAYVDVVEAWKGREDQLNERAFGLYENFRPSVRPGARGWGAKGQLNLHRVRSVAPLEG